MDTNIFQQMRRCILPDTPVILNIGLGRPTHIRSYGLTQGTILARATLGLRDIMYDVRGEVQPKPEATLVISGSFNQDATLSTALWELVLRCNQDCISIWYPQYAKGELFGPLAENWSPFELAAFRMPMFKPLTERMH